MTNEFSIGQKVTCRPQTLSMNGVNDNKEHHPVRAGKICYIHPKGHYVTVEIEERGGVVRESFKLWEVWS